MARPSKQTREKRDHFLTLRLTDEEQRAIHARAANVNATPSVFVREAALGAKLRIVQSPPTLPFAAIEELRRIGVNLNQLARIANATGEMPARLEPLLEQITALFDEAIDRDMDRLEALDAKDATDPAVLTGE
ncbi:MAG: MobC family plasmid mobilization relaxosome protein [Opitutae bacterium]|nr:MobC family plasmid mobilization relaxosome protein [Opitutae bacterium]